MSEAGEASMVRWLRDEARRSGPFPAVRREALLTVASEMAVAHPWVEAVYLFGSRARGDARPGSDVDLAALPRASNPPPDRITAEAVLARFAEDRLGAPVDVVLIRRELSPALLFDIFSVETILYARDPEVAHRIACQARAEYRDERPRLERALQRTRQQIEELAHALNRSRASAASVIKPISRSLASADLSPAETWRRVRQGLPEIAEFARRMSQQ